jgi:hypothetical protein
MKTHLKHLAGKINFWNLFIGIIIGFGLGVTVINALVPNADEMIRMYHLDRATIDREHVMRGTGVNVMYGTTTPWK